MLINNLFKYWTYQVFFPGTVLREKYEAFKALLEYDKCAHELMAELEEIYHDRIKVDFSAIEGKYNAFSSCVRQIVESLQKMSPARYQDLMAYYKKFDFYIRFMLSSPEYDFSPPFTLELSHVTTEDASRIGGKALNAATFSGMLDLPIPPGFVITTNAFYYFLEYSDLRKAIDSRLSEIDIRDTPSLKRISDELVHLVMSAQVPEEIEASIMAAYHSIDAIGAGECRVAVRSSAVGEDSRSSFAGQYKTVLNVRRDGLADAYTAVVASKYSPEALYYRINYGLSDMETPMAVLVLEMIDAQASGVMYTLNLDEPEAGLLDVHSIWGLGELLVQGEVSPDIFKVRKGGEAVIVDRRTGLKPRQMVFENKGGTKIVAVEKGRQKKSSLDDEFIRKLAEWGMRMEGHYQEPQDVEWCLDHKSNLYLLQSRPLRREAELTPSVECVEEDISSPILLSGGDRASSGAGSGPVFRVEREADLDRISEGAVLVAKNASSAYVRVMGKLSAVVTDSGSTAGHFASVAREFGVPTVVNAGTATRDLAPGRTVTVYADRGVVYDGMVQTLLESPCVRRDLIVDSPFASKLEYVIGFISPLRLVDPEDAIFAPEGCRSMHDIIRFAHEKSVQEMFTVGNRRTGRKLGAKKLVSQIPIQVYVLDIGDGLVKDASPKKEIHTDDVRNEPLLAVWKGLNHPDIQWSQFSHFNWEEYDRIVMSGGIISADSAQLASYAVLSAEYLNLNLKFGYHFVILDTICSERSRDNHILFRFAGGGGDFHGRSLRAEFLSRILERIDFEIDKKGDLVDAKFKAAQREEILEKLDILGRLLGATRLMDMYLKTEDQVPEYAEAFLQGRYHFSSVDLDQSTQKGEN
ncbi:MAG: PEP/pyruvate-binding domain-containing protein [Thermodesulfobacteriota bacterium]